MRWFFVLAALALVLAGCGSAPLYKLAKTRSCLAGTNRVRLVPPTDFVATSATGGSTRALFSGNAVTVVFGATQSDADNIAAEYRRVAAANVGIDDVLREQRNAVMLWHLHPQTAQESVITGCLR